jgi:hypothetical protein
MNARYFAPESYRGLFLRASDVFSFGLILYELLVGAPAFPHQLSQWQIAYRVEVLQSLPDIPDSVLPCWEIDPDDRPSFAGLVDRLAEMQFKVTADVNSAKLSAFVATN